MFFVVFWSPELKMKFISPAPGFEKATQAFAVLGIVALVLSCLLAVYLNFFTQNKGHNRWLEITSLVAGTWNLIAWSPPADFTGRK